MRIVYTILLIAVCAGVFFGIVLQLFVSWEADGWGGRAAKIVLVLAWVWASLRLISRLSNSKKK